MSRFAGKDPRRIHHLKRDPEFLVELPQRVQILNIVARHGEAIADSAEAASARAQGTFAKQRATV